VTAGRTQELEAERVELMEGVMSNKRKMQELETNLLHKLTSTEVRLVVVVMFLSVFLCEFAGHDAYKLVFTQDINNALVLSNVK